MRPDTYLLTFFIAACILFNPSVNAADKELRKQRAAAQKEQRFQIKERSEVIKDAKRSFKEFTREINNENRERVSELETEFSLTKVDLRAAHEVRVAAAEADHQKKLMDLFMDPSGKFDKQKLQQMETDFKKHSDELFALKKQSAEEVHQAKVKHIINKNKIYDEGDQKILEEASTLGLTNEYSPILITPTSGAHTKQEERIGTFQGEAFNQQEFSEKIAENNKKKSMITIEYKKIRDKNRIKRNKIKKEILSK